jgi:hypothetical protein
MFEQLQAPRCRRCEADLVKESGRKKTVLKHWIPYASSSSGIIYIIRNTRGALEQGELKREMIIITSIILTHDILV